MQLVITEKMSVGKSIAEAAGITKMKGRYMEGNGYLVSWYVGHLVEPAQPESYGERWKKWTYGSLPVKPEKWKYEVKPDTREQYEVLAGLMHREDVDCVICATDAGREGELIFRLVYEMAGCSKPVKRLWISSMEEKAIRDGFDNLRPGEAYNCLYASALCRQRADWLVGINGTRLFTVLYGNRVLKVGRVQTPTLALLAEREEEIRNFKKERYYSVHILCDGMDAASERVNDKKEADGIAGSCREKPVCVEQVVREEKTSAPPKLYDLTTLQRDANRIFGFTAKQTLEYTQSLYEKKFVTYPRTDSRYLSDDMEQTAKKVIEAVGKADAMWGGVSCKPDIKRVLDSKKVTDHHGIIPTVEIGRADMTALPETERKILLLIGNRLLCATGRAHLYESVKVELSCGGYGFYASGKSVMENGWMDFEEAFRNSYRIREEGEKEAKLPVLAKGQSFTCMEAEVRTHDTTPPKAYTEDSLLSAMERAGAEDMGDEVERKGLGTPATRADVIEKLVRDGFVKREKKRLVPTKEGMELIAVLPDIVKSPKLTADWENALTLVSKGQLSMEDFMAGIEGMVSGLVQDYQGAGGEAKRIFAPEQEALGVCPNCGGQVVKGKFGAYCENKCGMIVGRAMGVALSDAQIKDLLGGKKILLKGLKSKTGKEYDAYIIPNGTEDYVYKKDGEEKRGVRFKVGVEFPEKKARSGKGKI